MKQIQHVVMTLRSVGHPLMVVADEINKFLLIKLEIDIKITVKSSPQAVLIRLSMYNTNIYHLKST